MSRLTNLDRDAIATLLDDERLDTNTKNSLQDALHLHDRTLETRRQATTAAKEANSRAETMAKDGYLQVAERIRRGEFNPTEVVQALRTIRGELIDHDQLGNLLDRTVTHTAGEVTRSLLPFIDKVTHYVASFRAPSTLATIPAHVEWAWNAIAARTRFELPVDAQLIDHGGNLIRGDFSNPGLSDSIRTRWTWAAVLTGQVTYRHDPQRTVVEVNAKWDDRDQLIEQVTSEPNSGTMAPALSPVSNRPRVVRTR